MLTIFKRFSEASSWAAIGGVLMLVGVNLPDALWQHLANVAAALSFTVGFFRKEAGNAE